MKKILDEFLEFLEKNKVLGIAIAVVIGSASTKLVTAIVNDLIMPIISVLTPGGQYREFILQIGPINFLIGDFIGALIDFFIVALVIFLIVKFIIKDEKDKKE